MNPQRDGRLGIGIIGSGRVGPILGSALAGAGHALVGISAVSEHSKERAQAILPDVPIVDVPRLVELSELVLIAIDDDQLPDFVEGLAQTRVWQPGQIVVHTSPRWGVEILEPATRQGVIPVGLHPVMDFTGTSMDLVRLSECYIAVSAPSPVLPIAQALAVEIGGEPIVIQPEQREAFAEALSLARNFSSTLVSESTGILDRAGVINPAQLLAPLLRSTVDNALRHIPQNVTLEADRGDA